MLPLNQILEEHKKRASEEHFLQGIHHSLMVNYGWIPFEEFKKLPLPVLWDLVEMINIDNEERTKVLQASQKRK